MKNKPEKAYEHWPEHNTMMMIFRIYKQMLEMNIYESYQRQV